jgi:hypothetical protein
VASSFDGSTAAAERHDLLAGAPHGKHQLEAADAIVVLGARLDEDLFERRRLAVAAGPQDPHVGRPVVHHPDEVLGLARIRQAFPVRQRHTVRVVPIDDEDAFELVGGGRSLEVDRAALAERQRRRRDRPVGPHVQLHARARGSIDVAAVHLRARREAGE